MRFIRLSDDPVPSRLHHVLARFQGEVWYWGITLLMMLDDDAAMLAMMFS
jgi:hypothetical protein